MSHRSLLSLAPLLFTLFASSLFASQANESIVARIDGVPVTIEDITHDNKQEIYEAELALYQLKRANLRRVLVERLIKLDPRSKGLDVDEFLRRFVIRPIEITDSDIDQFIKDRQIPKSRVNATLRQQIRQYLSSQDFTAQIDAWIEKQAARHQIEIYLQEPEIPRYRVSIENAPWRGGKNAPVTIVEFSDFECPYCASANNTLRQLLQEYGDRIKIVYKHLPLSELHAQAQNLAVAGVCAYQQDNQVFWRFHDWVFANNRGLSLGKIKDMAAKLGIDRAFFDQCIEASEARALVNKDLKEAERLGFNATPAFLVNGIVLNGAQPIKTFRQLIEAELKKQNNKR